jgi:methionyl aminopeptidase
MKEQYIQDFIQAGQLAKEVRAYGKSLIIKGASYNDVISKINAKIVTLGAIAAFPPQISLNDVAAHFLPQPNEEIIFSDQVVKLDVGVCFNGAIGDCAITIDLSGKHQKLIDAAEAGLLAAEQSIKVGQPLRSIGKIIDDTICSYGYQPVRNLSGHGLGFYKIHMPPTIPNYDNRSTAVIKPGMTFAIEPFATNGRGLIYESGRPAIFSLIKSRPARTPATRFLMEKINAFNGLPFAVHHFVGETFSLGEVNEGLNVLLKTGVIAGYPPLVEEMHGMVAQAENSVLVDNDGNILITTR